MKKCCNRLRLRVGDGVDENLQTPTPVKTNDSGRLRLRLRSPGFGVPWLGPLRQTPPPPQKKKNEGWIRQCFKIWNNAVPEELKGASAVLQAARVSVKRRLCCREVQHVHFLGANGRTAQQQRHLYASFPTTVVQRVRQVLKNDSHQWQ